MQPIYQGKIDVFCAAYAVLNGLRTTHGLKLMQCRELFHQALLHLTANPQTFAQALAQEIDYVDWVDYMLQNHIKLGILKVVSPYTTNIGTPNEIFQTIDSWVGQELRGAALFQFKRQLPLVEQNIYHWTACSQVKNEALYLDDSCLDDTALRILHKSNLQPSPELQNSDQIHIFPHTVRLIKPKLGLRPVPYK